MALQASSSFMALPRSKCCSLGKVAPGLSSSRWPLVGCLRSSHRSAVVPEEALEVSGEENDVVFPSPAFTRDALISSSEQYQNMYKRSIEDPARFWSEIASQFYWKKRWNPEVYSENIDVRKGAIKIEWFKGGITNVSYNALDRNIQAGNGDKVAIYWEGNEPGQDGQLTYSQLLDKVCQIGAFAAPDKIHWAPELPKTRSGKIMRRILRKIASKQLDDIGDTSTLANPSAVEQLIEFADG